MTTTSTPHLVKVEDHEGTGTCGACDREGLRWVCILSDGSRIGTECAKKLMGWKMAPKAYNWVADFEPVAEFVEYGATYVLWQYKRGAQTRETRNGHLVAVGGRREEWKRMGWLS